MQLASYFFMDITIISSRFIQVYLGMKNKILMQNELCGFYTI